MADGTTRIFIGVSPKADNPFMKPTPGSFLWYCTGRDMDRLGEPVLHINSMKLHPICLENYTFCQPCALTEDLLDMSAEGGK